MKTLLLILVLPFNLWGQETDKALNAKINLSSEKSDRGSGSVAQIDKTITCRIPQTTPSLELSNKTTTAQIFPVTSREIGRTERLGAIARVAPKSGTSSVQPAIAACPRRMKAPVDSGLLGKIIVPYDNSLFLRSDLPYFLGDSYIPRSSRERAQSQIVP